MFSNQFRLFAANSTMAIAVLISTTNSEAFLGAMVGYLGFDVDVGLDTATSEFLQQYPKEIRIQLVQGANEVLDRADESVARVFVQSQGLLLGVQDVAICVGRVGEHIPRGMLERIFGIRPDSYSAIAVESLNQFRSHVQLIDSPTKIANGYTDVDNIVSDAFCLTLQSDLDHFRSVRLRPEVKTSGLLWTRLEPLCGNVRDCYALSLATVRTSMTNAVEQDLVKTKAAERFSAINQPPPPSAGWRSNFDFLEYEHALNALLAINDDLIRVSSARAKAGNEKLLAFEGMHSQIAQWMSAAEDEPNLVTRCNRGYQIAGAVKDLGNLREQAEGYDLLRPAELDAMKAKFEKVSARQKALAATTGKFMNNGNRCWDVVIRAPNSRISQ